MVTVCADVASIYQTDDIFPFQIWFGVWQHVSATSELHIYRGKFVYVDITPNCLQFVIGEVKLKKLSSDKVAFGDS